MLSSVCIYLAFKACISFVNILLVELLFPASCIQNVMTIYMLLLEEAIHKGLLASFTDCANCVGFSMLSN